MDNTKPIELGIAEKLKTDESYRKAFFRAYATDSIALQIRELRKRRELKQTELAAAADMKQSAVSRIEQAEYSSWTFNTLWRVAEALDARLIVTFQPMEEAIRDYGISEGTVVPLTAAAHSTYHVTTALPPITQISSGANTGAIVGSTAAEHYKTFVATSRQIARVTTQNSDITKVRL